jgi:hypothetical protein
VAEKTIHDSQSYLICHHYDIGDLGVTVRAPIGFDAKRAAVYVQFWAEEWFGDGETLSNLGIAAALVVFYGCKHTQRNPRGEVIDLFFECSEMCARADKLMADPALHREGLREFLIPHLCD